MRKSRRNRLPAEDDDDRPQKSRRDEDEEEDRPKKKKNEDDFEVVDDDDDDRPRSKRRRDDDDDDRPRSRSRRDDDDDDRPRSRSRRDDDDDDDRPRSKRRRDDEDDRPRSRNRRDEDYDDDDYDVSKPKSTKGSPSQYRNARTGMNLLAIGFSCAAVAMGSMALINLLGRLTETRSLADMVVISGLLGIAHWILGAVGISFLMAGPKRGNLMGLCIALVSVTGLHLILLIVVVTDDSMVRTMGGDSATTAGLWCQLISLSLGVN